MLTMLRKPCFVLAAIEHGENTAKKIRVRMRREIDGDITYPLLMVILKYFEELKLVRGKMEGRHFIFTLTEKGKLMKKEADNLCLANKSISMQGGAEK